MATRLVFTTVRGAPGCTVASLAVAAALAEASESLWVEADPAGGVLAATAVGVSPRPSLEDVAFADARTADTASLVDGAVQRLGDLAVLPAPADGWLVSMALDRPRHEWVSGIGRRPGWVVADVGRMSPASPAWPLVRVADVVVVVCAPEPVSLASALEWVERGRGNGDDVTAATSSARLLTVAPPRGVRRVYGADRLRAELGDRYWGELPFDARAVEVLLRGASTRHRSLRSTPLLLAARAMTHDLTVARQPPVAAALVNGHSS